MSTEKKLPWKRWVVRVKEEDRGSIIGLFPSTSSIPDLSPKTISLGCRSKNKQPLEDGFIYYWSEDYEVEFPGHISNYLSSLHPLSLITRPDHSTSLNLVLTLGGKIVSVNDLYKARVIYKAGRPMATIYKNPKAVDVSKEIYRQLGSIDFSPYMEWLRSTNKYKVSINFVVKSGINRRDVENLGKSIIDTVVRHIRETVGVKHFDDSEFLEIYFTKSIIPGSKHEYAMINIIESSHDIRFDHIPSPDYYYLSGEVWGEEWKDIMAGELTKRGLKWYCPECNPWDPMEWGEKEQDDCNTWMTVIDLKTVDGDYFLRIYNKVLQFHGEGKRFLRIAIIGSLDETDWRYRLVKEMEKRNGEEIKVVVVDKKEEIIKVI